MHTPQNPSKFNSIHSIVAPFKKGESMYADTDDIEEQPPPDVSNAVSQPTNPQTEVENSFPDTVSKDKVS